MFRFDGKNLVICFIILAIVMSVFNVMNGQSIHDYLLSLLVSLPGLIIALTFHEYAHARTAVKLGDPTPQMQGRCSLNPMDHLDPVGTICLLVAGFGWGKPVQINPMNFKNPSKDSAKVAAAGPIMNFIITIICALLYAVLYIVAYKVTDQNELTGSLGTFWELTLRIVICTMILNLGLGLFNLLPIPPLDGSKIFRHFLKDGIGARILDFLENYSTIIIMILFITDLANVILSPIRNFILVGIIYLIEIIINAFL